MTALSITAVIVGAQRSGTTSLAAALAEHPGICLARGKEAHLFDDPVARRQGIGPDDLRRAFPDAQPGQVLATDSPVRLWSYVDRGRYHDQVRRLREMLPDALVLPFARLVEPWRYIARRPGIATAPSP